MNLWESSHSVPLAFQLLFSIVLENASGLAEGRFAGVTIPLRGSNTLPLSVMQTTERNS